MWCYWEQAPWRVIRSWGWQLQTGIYLLTKRYLSKIEKDGIWKLGTKLATILMVDGLAFYIVKNVVLVQATQYGIFVKRTTLGHLVASFYETEKARIHTLLPWQHFSLWVIFLHNSHHHHILQIYVLCIYLLVLPQEYRLFEATDLASFIFWWVP